MSFGAFRTPTEVYEADHEMVTEPWYLKLEGMADKYLHQLSGGSASGRTLQWWWPRIRTTSCWMNP